MSSCPLLQAVPQHAPDCHNFRRQRRLHQRDLPGHPETEPISHVSQECNIRIVGALQGTVVRFYFFNHVEANWVNSDVDA